MKVVSYFHGPHRAAPAEELHTMNATIPIVAASRSGITHSVAPGGTTACGFTVRYGLGWDGLADTAPVTCLRCSHLPVEAPARVVAAGEPRDEVSVALPLGDAGGFQVTAPTPTIATGEQLYVELDALAGTWWAGVLTAHDVHRVAGAMVLRLEPALIDAAADGGPAMLAGELVTLVDETDRGLHTPAEFARALTARVAGYDPIHAQVAAAVAAEKDEADALSAVTGDEDLDVAQCDLFGHEPFGGRCEVCGEPGPAVAAVLTDAAEHPVTITGEPGGFGAALAVFGFGEGERGDSMSEGVYWAFDHATAPVRVVCYTDDGNRVALIGFDPARPAARLVAWKASFDGSTPQHAVLTALAAALGILPAAR